MLGGVGGLKNGEKNPKIEINKIDRFKGVRVMENGRLFKIDR